MQVPSVAACKFCGTDFTPNPWKKDRSRFCSPACRDKGKHGTLEERFWRDIVKTRTCWNFQKTGWRGYGRLSLDHRHVSAHRYSWELHFGPIPDGLLVCHHCDNPACVRPDHLFLGTDAMNAADRNRKGRTIIGSRENIPRGADHYLTTLSNADVRKIRRLFAKGNITKTELGARFGVGRTCIYHIINRTSWAHIN